MCLVLLFSGVWATMGVLGVLPVAWRYWEDGAGILPVLKKRGEGSVGAIVAPMCFSDLGLGVAAGADVSEGDLFGVLVLVGRGFLASCVAGVEPNTDVVILHVGSWDPVDAFAGGLFLGVAIAVAGSATATVASAGGAGGVEEVSVRLLLLNEVTADTFQAFFDLGPRIGPLKFPHLPGPNECIAKLEYILMGKVEAHGDHELLE